ncbi:MAG: zf-TFIIB domain-containing protein [Candidatus Sungbacteria bacterium]|nr:zf-TFIIB domain-containing protein [Candidatus Sungbacteria bacterium]
MPSPKEKPCPDCGVAMDREASSELGVVARYNCPECGGEWIQVRGAHGLIEQVVEGSVDLTKFITE